METVKNVKSDLSSAKFYLKYSGLTATPDSVKEALCLGSSASTIGRKFRAASVGPNPELLRSYYESKTGRMVTRYAWNPNYKENI